jgi:hypothetical protein
VRNQGHNPVDVAKSSTGERRGIHRPASARWHPGLVPEDLTFTCPRCEDAATAPFYGPCGSCRDDLRRSLGGGTRVVEDIAYEPKMHVTPNAVALKD